MSTVVRKLRECTVGILVVVLVLAAASEGVAQLYPPELRYRKRGDRSEGLLGTEKSSNAIVLLSAVAESGKPEALTQWPDALKLRFFLPRADEILLRKVDETPFVRVRQLRPLTGYYALDNVVPAQPWRPGLANVYSWRTTVVQGVYAHQAEQNPGVKLTPGSWLTGLGVVISLGPSGAVGSLQSITVVPAMLRQDDASATVARYLFTFTTTTAPATLTGAIRSAASQVVLPNLSYQTTPASQFTVQWLPTSAHVEGWYTLALEGKLPGEPHIDVRFYHRPSL